MRSTIMLVLAPLVLADSPAAAAPPAPPLPTVDQAVAQAQQALDDPRTEQAMSGTIESLTGAFLNLPVGELQAAAEGRTATAAEKRLTVRDVARRDDPNFEANLRQQIAESGPAIRRGMKSLSTALPALVKSFKEAGAAIERATANLPDPTYPKR